jgi:hypothetical protein
MTQRSSQLTILLLALFVAFGGLPRVEAAPALAVALVSDPLAGVQRIAPNSLAEPSLLVALTYSRGNLVSTSGG